MIKKKSITVAVVVGTRPEIIKLAPVITALQKRDVELLLIHTNQHWSGDMDQVFFEELGLPQPDYNLNITQDPHPNQIGSIILKIDPVIRKEKPDLVIVQGDTNTVVGAALASEKCGVPVAHVEAGLRSWDRTMPEESNRVLTDHLSSLHFAVTDVQRQNLTGEGIKASSIHVVGNTVVDALKGIISNADASSVWSAIGGRPPNGWLLATCHRAGNVDQVQPLCELMACLEKASALTGLPVLWPIHPRAFKRINEFKIPVPGCVKVVPPVGYSIFSALMSGAKCILTDSGGVQEEACALGVPCITLRENTERPETVDVGANVLVGRDIRRLENALDPIIRGEKRDWVNPFGDGTSGRQIVDVCLEYLGVMNRPEDGRPRARISVVGLGYMGLPTACLFAAAGHEVQGYDVSASRVEDVNAGRCPFDEPGMSELLEHVVCGTKKLRASPELLPADVYILALPTPSHQKKCDLSFVEKGIAAVSERVKDGDLVILESTVKPGTCDKLLVQYFKQAGKKVHVAHCPERAIPGNTLHELTYNDRVVGASNPEAAALTKALYQSFCRGEILVTDLVTAEAVKLMENTYRDVNIALANEVLAIGRDLGFDVWKAIELANRHPRVNYLSPGPGVGGHCIAVDPWFLVEDSSAGDLIRTSRKINEERPYQVAEQIMKIADQRKTRKVALLGVAYKKNVDDARESPAEVIYERLHNEGYQIRAHDPYVRNCSIPLETDFDAIQKWADISVLVTDHDFYVEYFRNKGCHDRGFLIDTRNCVHTVLENSYDIGSMRI
jgi:UDP-N-acetylglucosamine 2-epimerase (non-hydrolysing)